MSWPLQSARSPTTSAIQSATPSATNLAVPIEFPKLRAKYGPSVNYAQGRHQHVQTEFAFDIDEVAHHRTAPIHYLRHIGLQVPVRQLAVAYYQTYGITEDFTGTHKHRFNVSGYRFAVRTFIPRIAYAVTLLHRNHEPPEASSPERVELDAEFAALAIENNWQAYRRKAGIGTYTLAGILFIVPKIGPLSWSRSRAPLSQPKPTTCTASCSLPRLCVQGSPASLHRPTCVLSPPKPFPSRLKLGSRRAAAIGRFSCRPDRAPVRDPHHPLPNRDLDTGFVVKPGGYSLTDSTYANLLHRLTRTPAQPIPPGIKEDIQIYYADPAAPITTKKDPSAWAQVQADLATLATMPTSTEPEPYPTYGDEADSSQ